MQKSPTGAFPEGEPALYWEGKQEAFAAAQSPCTAKLSAPLPEQGNLYLEGDCLDAVKLLRERYAGRIRMVYLDPPYNTGSLHVYHDRFGKADWCSMMYARLLPVRDLLTEDGVVFISIGEQQLHMLLCLCDEIFRPENRLALLHRVTKKSSNNGDHFSPCVDYVLMYARDAALVPPYTVPLPEEIVSRYKRTDEHVAQRGPYQEVSLYMSALKHGGSRYPITCPDGSRVIPPDHKPWRWNEATFRKGLSEGRIVFKASRRSPLRDADTGQRAKWNLYTKMYLSERQQSGLQPKNFTEAFPNTLATHELRRLGIPFDFAKPVSLIAYLARLQTAGEDIVLDLFSGSGTTAHAVMQLNAEDGGHRRFILVQLPEPTAPDSRAAQMGFSDLCEIGKERIRRAGEQLRQQYPELETDFTVLRILKEGED